MPNWIQVTLLAIAYGFSSPHYSMETLPGDIMYSKVKGRSLYEVRVISVDSLRTMKRFWSGEIYSAETRDSMPGSKAIFRISYRCQFEVISDLAGRSHSKKIPLIAVDSRGFADAIWKRFWTEEKRKGKTFILILEKNGQVRALYQAVASLQGKDDMAQAWSKAVSKEMNDLLRNKDYMGYLYINNLEKLFRREGFDIN